MCGSTHQYCVLPSSILWVSVALKAQARVSTSWCYRIASTIKSFVCPVANTLFTPICRKQGRTFRYTDTQARWNALRSRSCRFFPKTPRLSSAWSSARHPCLYRLPRLAKTEVGCRRRGHPLNHPARSPANLNRDRVGMIARPPALVASEFQSLLLLTAIM